MPPASKKKKPTTATARATTVKTKATATATRRKSPRVRVRAQSPNASSEGLSDAAPEDDIKALVAKVQAQAEKKRSKRREKRKNEFDAQVNDFRDTINQKFQEGSTMKAELCKNTNTAIKRLVLSMQERVEIEQQLQDEVTAMLLLYQQAKRELQTAVQARTDALDLRLNSVDENDAMKQVGEEEEEGSVAISE